MLRPKPVPSLSAPIIRPNWSTAVSRTESGSPGPESSTRICAPSGRSFVSIRQCVLATLGVAVLVTENAGLQPGR